MVEAAHFKGLSIMFCCHIKWAPSFVSVEKAKVRIWQQRLGEASELLAEAV
jgi:hypothetical protein